ncbi:MAG: hypothetical protein AB1413_07195 [Thermodesulfobacteriota bacterium]
MRELYSTQLAIAVGILILIASAAFALMQSPELLEHGETAAVRSAMAMPHPVEGMRSCHQCHGIKGELPYPLKHTGWSDASCPKCHRADK